MIRRNLFVFTLAALCFANILEAEDSSIKINENGSFSVDGIKAGISYFAKDWKRSDQTNKIQFSVIKDNTSTPSVKEFQGKMQTPDGGELLLAEKISEIKADSCIYEASISSEKELEAADLTLSFSFPISSIADKKILFDQNSVIAPKENPEEKTGIFASPKVTRILIPLEKRKLLIEGEFPVAMQDNRKFQGDSFSLRIRFSPFSGKIKNSSLKFKLSLIPYEITCMDIARQANMGFSDSKSEDKTGGWTDQGPDNDLRSMPSGIKNFAGVKFKIIDPATNSGKSCIVLSGPSREYFPSSVKIPADAKAYKYIYMLHASAWTPRAKNTEIGTITANYKDGSKSIIPVKTGEDIADWWNPSSIKNAAVVWTAENGSNYTGLYLSKFKLEDKNLDSLQIESNGKAVWMICGISSSNDEISLPADTPYYIVADKNWKEFIFEKDIKKGSIMDFSGLLDAPAGKYGKLNIQNGHWAFEKQPDTPQRFYGTNLCIESVFLDKETAEKVADRIAASGYNSVRFHAFDRILTKETAPGAIEFNADKLDQMDYLFQCLKKRGIYITIDLYISRIHKKDEIKEFPETVEPNEFKALVFVLDSVMQSWQDFSGKLMLHKNPYTGLLWKDDPALISISLINEDTIFAQYARSPLVKEIYIKKFKDWAAKKQLSDSAPYDYRSNINFRNFLIETYNIGFFKMKDYLRSIGAGQALSDQNMWTTVPMNAMRKNYDYVDNHYYYEHPGFPVKTWSLPTSLNNLSAVSKFASQPAGTFASRIFGKPIMITEFDYPKPNMFRAEGAALTSAYAALQDWDGLYRFDFSSQPKQLENEISPVRPSHFSTSLDPLKTVSERIGILFFLRKDISKSDLFFPVIVSDKYNSSEENPEVYPAAVKYLGLIGQTGTLLADDSSFNFSKTKHQTFAIEKQFTGKNGVKKLEESPSSLRELASEGIIKQGLIDVEKGIYRSSTGELEINGPAKTFKAISPRSETFIGQALQLDGKVCSVKPDNSFTVISIAAMDDKPLNTSGRILILHLTDIQPSKIKFGNDRGTLMEEWGKLPYLLKKGTVEIKIKTLSSSPMKLYAVDTAGKRLFEVPFVKDQESINIKVDNHAGKTGIIAYELTNE